MNLKAIFLGELLVLVIFALATSVRAQSPSGAPTGGGDSSKPRPKGVSLVQVQRGLNELKSQPKVANSGRDYPSLIETVNWLKEKLESHAGVASIVYDRWTSRSEFRYPRFEINGCQMMYRERHTYSVDNVNDKDDWSRVDETDWAIELAKLDPNSIKVIEYDNTPLGGTSKGTIAWVVTWEEREMSQKTTNWPVLSRALNEKLATIIYRNKIIYIGFVLDGQEIAERVQKALQHAVIKCSGKPEPF